MRDVAGLAIDGRALARLREQATKNPDTAVREAAAQFESLFMQQMLKSMRQAIPSSGLMDGPGQSTYQEMLDGQMAQLLSGRAGGLADVLARQLSSHIGAATEPGAAKPAPASIGQPPALFEGAKVSTVGGFPQVLGGSTMPPAVPPAALAPAPPADGPGAGNIGPVAGSASPAQREFVRRLLPHAQAAERQTGVRADFILGQAALESGWGKAEMRHPDGRPAFNLFGIKAGAGWNGRTVDVLTTEYQDGKARKVVDKFRAYDSYAQAFTDWARLMSGNPRYGEVVKAGASAEDFASGLQEAGYATDPNYARKLEKTIERTIALRGLRT